MEIKKFENFSSIDAIKDEIAEKYLFTNFR